MPDTAKDGTNRGGARPGAGRKKKSLDENITEGKTPKNVFRLSVELKEDINPDLLAQALRKTLPRFPAFDVRIKKGFFWYYFEKNPNGAPPVMPDINNPCHRIKFKENSGYLFRVYYHARRISIDTFHSLADGHGSAVFILSLAAEYLRLTGEKISYNEFSY